MSVHRRTDTEGMVGVYSGVRPSREKECSHAICSKWMGLEITRLSEVSQTETEKGFIVLLICGVLKN